MVVNPNIKIISHDIKTTITQMINKINRLDLFVLSSEKSKFINASKKIIIIFIIKI